MRIEVTTEDIKSGRRGDPESCPIALAICRALNIETGEATVDEIEVDFYVDQPHPAAHLHTIRLPPEAGKFVESFDCGEHVAPIAFDLPL